MSKVQPVKYQLRSDPIEVSKIEINKVFCLNDYRPLEYIVNDYVDKGDGTITDFATGLMWQRSGSTRWLEYDAAKTYIEKLNKDRFAGYTDWRLPTIPELMSLLEPERKQPDGLYIDPMFEKKQEWCWSSDLHPGGGVWNVSFYFGGVGWDDLDDTYVRAVRSGDEKIYWRMFQ